MRLEPGTMIAVAAALLFYLRLIVVQRQRSKQIARNSTRQAKKTALPPQVPALFVIRNPILVGAGVLLIAVGAVISIVPAYAASFGASWWWVPVTLGILLMGLGVG